MERILLIGATIVLGSMVVYFYYYKVNKTGCGIEKPLLAQRSLSKNVPRKMPNSYLDAIKKATENKVGKGPMDTLMTHKQPVSDDMYEFIPNNQPSTDDGTISIIDPSEPYDNSGRFNEPLTDSSTDTVAYNLYANPDNNNFEVITSKELYLKAEYPSIVDSSFVKTESMYYVDNLANDIIYATPRDSINNSENIDPSLTDGIIYYPDNSDVNNQNLYTLIRNSIDDRSNNTQSVYLDNNILDQSVFSIF